MGRLKSAFFGVLTYVAFAAPTALATPGNGGGGDHDTDTSDHDTVDTSDHSGPVDDSGPGDDRSGPSDESGSDRSGDSGADNSGSGDSGSSGDQSGSGSSGSSDDSDDGNSGSNSGHGSSGSSGSDSSISSSHNAGSGHDRVEVTRNEAGERVRTGEAMLLTKRDDAAGELEREGFRVVEMFRVEAVGATAFRVALPERMSQKKTFDALRALDPNGVVTFNHIYSPAGQTAAVGEVHGRPKAVSVRVRVGLVDAGVNVKHPMLKRVVVNARAFDPNARTSDAHGTAVASLIAVAAPGATVFAANVFTLSVDGQEVATADKIVRALDWLATLQVPVINLSLTGPANPILEAVVAQLTAKGHILVAAVGNEGPRGAAQYPAAYEHVVGVTAVDRRSRVYLYANQGDYVDFAAPGVDLPVANPAGAVETVSGTSYAAPIVAAKLAREIDKPDVLLADRALKALAARAHDLGAPGRDPVFGLGYVGTDD